jgi:predicted TPR repeat methyltransferase
MQWMLPELWTEIKSQTQQKGRQQCKLVDMGCGTGRNTLQLLDTVCRDAPESNIQIIGVDASNGMLDIARQRTNTFLTPPNIQVKLAPLDLLADIDSPSNAQTRDLIRDADGMISTLVLEHIPIDTFFGTAASILRSGAYFLVSNMHADMGKRSQAGFVDSATGKKVRPSRSYAHELEQILAEAERCGFEVVQLPTAKAAGTEGVIEREVTPDMVERLGPRSRKYLGVCSVWLGVCFRRK